MTNETNPPCALPDVIYVEGRNDKFGTFSITSHSVKDHGMEPLFKGNLRGRYILERRADTSGGADDLEKLLQSKKRKVPNSAANHWDTKAMVENRIYVLGRNDVLNELINELSQMEKRG